MTSITHVGQRLGAWTVTAIEDLPRNHKWPADVVCLAQLTPDVQPDGLKHYSTWRGLAADPRQEVKND